jgi:hypothetical protein
MRWSRWGRGIAMTILPVLAGCALSASPAPASTNTCGLISQAGLAKALGLPHIATESKSVPIEPGGTWGECEIRAWSGAKPAAGKPGQCPEKPCVFSLATEFDKHQEARLIKGTLRFAWIGTVAQDPSSPLAQNWRYGYFGTLPIFFVPAGPKDHKAKPPLLGAEVAEGVQGGRLVLHAKAQWKSFSKLVGLRLAVLSNAKRKPVLLLNKIAATVVPAFGL